MRLCEEQSEAKTIRTDAYLTKGTLWAVDDKLKLLLTDIFLLSLLLCKRLVESREKMLSIGQDQTTF